jgi:hypothetical protein
MGAKKNLCIVQNNTRLTVKEIKIKINLSKTDVNHLKEKKKKFFIFGKNSFFFNFISFFGYINYLIVFTLKNFIYPK